jgi:LAO/AO transport system kinase
LAGQRRALSQAITLLESARAEDEAPAEQLLDMLLPHTGKADRLAFTGPPGVGKSTLIDAFGLLAIELGRRVAVLAVDPSSKRTGGSILGDKTRMARLAARAESFIRPSPSSGERGGIAPRTREAMLACEAAGFDLLLIETVGVGQAEFEVVDLVDALVVLLAPGAGDELQGMKRGILEHADLLAVCKADGADLERAKRAAADLASALALVAGVSSHSVLTVSALEGNGLGELYDAVASFVAGERKSERFAERRRVQERTFFARAVERGIKARLLSDERLRTRERELFEAVERGEVPARRAARELLDLIESCLRKA